MTIAPTIIETTDLEEMLEKSLPCEMPNKCRSQRSLPAEWILTHPLGDGTCSNMQCTPCHDGVIRYMEWCLEIDPNGNFSCIICGTKEIPGSTIIYRRI